MLISADDTAKSTILFKRFVRFLNVFLLPTKATFDQKILKYCEKLLQLKITVVYFNTFQNVNLNFHH